MLEDCEFSPRCKLLVKSRKSFLSFLYTVNNANADICFESNDNVRFAIHLKNLEATTGAFPPSDLPTYGEVVKLTESSKILDLLFQYIYPIQQPDISSLPFETLAGLAEAAEKYQVFPATFVCKIYMQYARSNYCFIPALNTAYVIENSYRRMWCKS